MGGMVDVITMSKRQLDAFREAKLRTFIHDIIPHMARNFPAKITGGDTGALVNSLRRRLDQALSFGLTERCDVLRYLECSYALDWTDEGPSERAFDVLRREALSAEQKLDVIEQWTESL